MRRFARTLVFSAAGAALVGTALYPSNQQSAHAQVTGLFNTGVDDNGTPLGDFADDTHYVLTADPSGLGDATVPSDGFPIPPWVANTFTSRWIGPNNPDTDGTGAAGEYVYRTTFNLAGPVSPTVSILGQWATDDPGPDIRVNGVSTGNTSPGFTTFTPFTISSSLLVSGANTLDFVVSNGGGPTGLHVNNLRAKDTSRVAPINTLYNTGVSETRTVLADNDVDPHYAAVAVPSPYDQVGTPAGNTTGASNFTGPGVVATSAGGFPIGPWVADNAASAWTTAGADTAGPGGNYAWRTSFDLTGFVPSTADITGQWSSDNGGVDILVNGTSTGQTNPGQFAGFTTFTIPTNLLVAGVNTIDFIVNNGAGEATEAGPTGVRVEFITREAEAIPEPGAVGLLALGGLGLLTRRRRRQV